MTAPNYNWQSAGYRPIPGWPSYIMNVDLDVWSLARHVPCKGGKTRHTSAKRIKQADGRVTLCETSRRKRFHVARELYPAVFPDRLRPQVECRKGHALVEFEHETLKTWMTPKPNVTYWGTGNRICLWCCEPPDTFPTCTYSRSYGVAISNHYGNAPAQPKLRDLQPAEAEELEWDEYGFTIN